MNNASSPQVNGLNVDSQSGASPEKAAATRHSNKMLISGDD